MTDGVIQSLWIQVPLLLISCYALDRSTDVFLDAIKVISERISVDEALIALLTAGAEWEELAVILSSTSTGHPDLAYSNLLGSCIANILGGLGLGLLFLPSGLEYDFSTKAFTAAQLAITIMGLAVLFYNSSIDRRLSAALFYATFIIYVASTLRLIWNGSIDVPEDSDDDSSKASSEDTDRESAPITEVNDETTALLANRARSTKRKKVAWLAFSLLASAGILSLASYFITTSLIILCNRLHITETTAGLTILSFITTIPEKAVAIKAGRRAQAGVILASTAGSNIFLLTLCLGVVTSFPAASQLQVDEQVIGITLACSIALTCMVFLLPGRTRWIGSTLLLCYCTFLFFELYKVPLT